MFVSIRMTCELAETFRGTKLIIVFQLCKNEVNGINRF